jgi:purine-binding chemotaxis protein CheW
MEGQMEALAQELMENEDTMRGKYLTFNVKEEVFGIEISYVTEIIGIQPFTRIPETEDYIKGIINLRGKIIPVVDIRLKFKKEPAEYTDRTCIIVIEAEKIIAGLIVDEVSEVLTIDDQNVVPSPQTGLNNRYIKGIGKVGGDVKLLLDCTELFDEKKSRQ